MLEFFKQLIPLLNTVTFGKGSIALYDREKFLVTTSGTKIQSPLKPGDKLVPESSSYKAIHSGKSDVAEVGAQIIGIPFIAVAYPIIINKEVIGGLTVIMPTEMSHIGEELIKTSSSLTSSLEQISAAIHNIAVSAQNLANAGQTVSQSI